MSQSQLDYLDAGVQFTYYGGSNPGRHGEIIAVFRKPENHSYSPSFDPNSTFEIKVAWEDVDYTQISKGEYSISSLDIYDSLYVGLSNIECFDIDWN